MPFCKTVTEPEMILIQIVQCSNPTYWYHDQIGGIFLVEPMLFREFYIVYSDSCEEELQLIKMTDCHVIPYDGPTCPAKSAWGDHWGHSWQLFWQKLKSRVKILGTLAFLGLLLLMPADNALAYTFNSLYAGYNDDYLGAGFSSIRQEYIADHSCLAFDNVTTSAITGMNQSTYYCFVDSQKELADQFLTNFSAAGPLRPGSTTAASPETRFIVENTLFSADKITIIAYWRQAEQRVSSTIPPKINDAALTVLKRDPRQFFLLYGDQYVSSAILGKNLFLVYQATAAADSARTRSLIRQAMALHIQQIFGAKLSDAEATFADAALAKVRTTLNAYGYGVPNFTPITSAEDLKTAIEQITASTVIARELSSYTRTSNGNGATFYNIAGYLDTVNEWQKTLSNLDYIATNARLSSKLFLDCQKTIHTLNEQMKLFYAGSNGTDSAKLDNQLLKNLYDRYLAEMHIASRTYHLPVIKNQTDLDLRGLGEVESLKIELIVKRSFFSRLFDRHAAVSLYILDGDGNWSEYQRIPLPSKTTRFTIYEGAKFRDRFRLVFSKPKSHPAVEIFCSYTEKPDDIILLQTSR